MTPRLVELVSWLLVESGLSSLFRLLRTPDYSKQGMYVSRGMLIACLMQSLLSGLGSTTIWEIDSDDLADIRPPSRAHTPKYVSLLLDTELCPLMVCGSRGAHSRHSTLPALPEHSSRHSMAWQSHNAHGMVCV